jgi:hypothetical protein
MATTYSVSKIKQIRVKKSVDELSNVVYAVEFIQTAVSDDGYRKDINRLIEFANPDLNSFIDISTITESIIISWIEASPEYLSQIYIDAFDYHFEQERQKPVYSSYNFPFVDNTSYYL